MKNPVNILKTTLSLLLVLVWFTHAHANCLAVQANINMPIDPTLCTVKPTVSQVLVNPGCPTGNLVFQALIGGTWVSNPTFTAAHVNQTFQYRVREIIFGASAMGNMTIRDVTKPVINCGPNVTVNCDQTCAPLPLPTVTDCGPTSLSYTETVANQPCASPNVKIVTRVYTAMDNSFNLSSCTKTYSIARPNLSAIVFPANVTMQVTGTDCTPWCETVVEGSPAPSSTVNGLSFAPGTPTIAGVPISPVNNPGTCNGVCVADCALGVNFYDQITPLCGTNRKIQRTWNVYSVCGGLKTHEQTIKIYTDGNTNCGAACLPPTTLTTTALGAGQYKLNWNVPTGCPVTYYIHTRFKVGDIWSGWALTSATTNTLTITKPTGATECNVHVRTSCNGVFSSLTPLYSFATPSFQEPGERSEVFEGVDTEMPEAVETVVAEPTLYPNPSNGEIFIDFKKALSENSQLTVMGLDGRIVHTQTLPAFTLQAALNLGELDNGLYLIQVQNADLSFTKKVQVLH